MSHAHNQPIPRAALLGAGGMIALSILAAGIARLSGTESMIPSSSPVMVRDLRFEDRADGGVDVFDGASTAPAAIVTSGSNAFLRATLRGLAQQRKRQAARDDVPFQLTAWADGRLTLDDPVTGRHVELEAFGHTNAAAFARLLTPQASAQ